MTRKPRGIDTNSRFQLIIVNPLRRLTAYLLTEARLLCIRQPQRECPKGTRPGPRPESLQYIFGEINDTSLLAPALSPCSRSLFVERINRRSDHISNHHNRDDLGREKPPAFDVDDGEDREERPDYGHQKSQDRRHFEP